VWEIRPCAFADIVSVNKMIMMIRGVFIGLSYENFQKVYDQRLFFFIARTSLSVRLSALAFCSEITAQIAAGIQPSMVICKIRQMIPVNILPLNMKERKGNKIAMIVIGYLIHSSLRSDVLALHAYTALNYILFFQKE
jgi:hypothetical protein